jgi:ATP-dependent exoDNAse (exonuclease V) alpha subunit
MIAERRDLSWEQENAGKSCVSLKNIPPCIYSCNAFGKEKLKAFSAPPDFFRDDSEIKYWDLPPSTICLWPYEVMYTDDVLYPEGSNQIYNYAKRLENAKKYFEKLTPGKSLIFYYANYSNPFNEGEEKKYVIVGISRLKSMGDVLFYDGTCEENKKKYAGGFIWQLNFTSHYPDEGFRIPYHLYQENPEILDSILFTPDNPQLFKYATREISDDNAIELIEQFLQIIERLIEIGDKSEDWYKRRSWLEDCVAELWRNRGAYPGLPAVLDIIGFEDAIPYFKNQVSLGNESNARDAIFAFLNEKIEDIPNYPVPGKNLILRKWKLKGKENKKILEELLPRIDISKEQMEKILSKDRQQNNLYLSIEDIVKNPYTISENYIGDDISDCITFSKIDHGMIPSPEIGIQDVFPLDDPRRLRALSVECLRREPVHCFIPVDTLIQRISRKIESYPEWRKHTFSENYFEIDTDCYDAELNFRDHEGIKYVYLKSVFESERLIEKEIRSLANRREITLRSPINDEKWYSLLHIPESPIYQKSPEEYEKIISRQREVCKKIFQKPISVITGAAGTGKTTILKSIITGIEQSHGSGASIQLLAPTGKAADRLRERTGKPADTIHSFLARNGWLNNNLTLKKTGGQQVSNVTNLIIDEASMLDLGLTAGLFRSINWNSVQRLIFVGDPNQLPPIGKGKIFADILHWLFETHSECIGELEYNIRQMENTVIGKGSLILQLASIYTRNFENKSQNQLLLPESEEILGKVQQGGDIDLDLRVIFWNTPEELELVLEETFKKDIETLSKRKISEKDGLAQLWSEVHTVSEQEKRANVHQILSPYRGELFGTGHINEYFQSLLCRYWLDKKGILGGITYFDKVIQIVNRPRSNPYWAYNKTNRKKERIEIYNGEIGFTKIHPHDYKERHHPTHIKQFQVTFSRKDDFAIDFTSEKRVEENLELAYAISVHKAQGSDFDYVYLILPKKKMRLLTPELLYTGLTRAKKHLTLFIEGDISPLLSLLRPEKSQLLRINSSLFAFEPLPQEILNLDLWYEEGKYYATLAEYLVRSKSEVIIANILYDRGIDFAYEKPLFAPDGTFYLPDFTITFQGEQYYLEHLGMLDLDSYKKHWNVKEAWYHKHFPKKLLVTKESADLSKEVEHLISDQFGITASNLSIPEKDWMEIIQAGESRNVEFKSSLRWSALSPGDKKVSEYIAMRAIASFINTEGGGTLFIGVSDKKEILGLEKDYFTLSKKDSDGFLLHLDNLINNYLGKEYHPYIKAEIVKIENKDVCVIEVSKGAKWVYLLSKDKDGTKQEFFIRGTSSSQPLDPMKAVEHIREHWPN